MLHLRKEWTLTDDAELGVNQEVGLRRRFHPSREAHGVGGQADGTAVHDIRTRESGWRIRVVVAANRQVCLDLVVPLLGDDFPQRAVNATHTIVVPPTKVAVVETNGLSIDLQVAVVGIVHLKRNTLLMGKFCLHSMVHHPLQGVFLLARLVDRLGTT